MATSDRPEKVEISRLLPSASQHRQMPKSIAALALGHMEIAKNLVLAGANLDTRLPLSLTPLMLAAQHKDG